MQREVVELIDDLDGGPATGTIEFGLDGKFYVIDLGDANAERLRSTMERYRAQARRLAPGTGRPYRHTQVPDDPRVVRAWARDRGHITGSQRVTQRIRALYAEAKRAGDTFADPAPSSRRPATPPPAVFSSSDQ
jgi:Lsr2